MHDMVLFLFVIITPRHAQGQPLSPVQVPKETSFAVLEEIMQMPLRKEVYCDFHYISRGKVALYEYVPECRLLFSITLSTI